MKVQKTCFNEQDHHHTQYQCTHYSVHTEPIMTVHA